MTELIMELLEDFPGWEYEEGFGMDGNLICPHGHMIEQDGRCPEGCVSPLRQLGII